MQIPKNKILFLIRSFNEASRIISVIEGIFLSGYTEVLIVDDGSHDHTYELLLEKFGSKIFLVRHSINRGAGAALETGFEFFRRYHKTYGWEYVVTFDADGQHDVKDMHKFHTYLEHHPSIEVVFGSRFIEKTESNVPFFRRIILWGGRIFTTLLSGVTLTDAHNGYRMFRASVIEKISLTMDGMEYASELIEELVKHHFHIAEVPVNIRYDDYTMKKGQRYGGAIRIAFRMILKKFF